MIRSRRADTTWAAPADPVVAAAAYTCAIAYGLPAPVSQLVLELRARLALRPERPRLLPHLTVLFLGRTTGAGLQMLQRALGRLASATAEVVLDDLGVFMSGAFVHNVHIAVVPQGDILSVHARALDVCADIGWRPQTAYVRERYVPHISIYDRIEVPAAAVATLPRQPLAGRAVRLDDPHLIYEPAT